MDDVQFWGVSLAEADLVGLRFFGHGRECDCAFQKASHLTAL